MTKSEKLQKEIVEVYDESAGIYEDIWGDHMHTGFYDPGADVSLIDNRSAQIRTVEEALRFASLFDDDDSSSSSSVQKPRNIVDVGCGLGGSSTYMAKKFEEAKCIGITNSAVQVQRAQALADAQGLGGKVSFQVADAMDQPFPDGQFDLVWAMEVGEHMPDRAKFVKELARVAAPGGTIIIVSWCHRDLSPGESLLPKETKLLNNICNAYHIASLCSTANYVNLFQSLSLQDIKYADWSENAAPFWNAVIRSTLTWKGITSLLRTGWKTIKGALAIPKMVQGYKTGVIKYSIITCRKPGC